jgi:hypothetical protein
LTPILSKIASPIESNFILDIDWLYWMLYGDFKLHICTMAQSFQASALIQPVFRLIQLVLAVLKLKDISYQRKLIRKIVCFNQSKLASYTLESSLLHAELASSVEIFRNIDPKDIQAKDNAKERLKSAIDNLDESLGNSLSGAEKYSRE